MTSEKEKPEITEKERREQEKSSNVKSMSDDRRAKPFDAHT